MTIRTRAINHVADHEDGDTAGEQEHDGAGQSGVRIGHVVGREPSAHLLHVEDRISERLGGKKDPGDDSAQQTRNLTELGGHEWTSFNLL